MGISCHFSLIFLPFFSTTSRHNPPQPTSCVLCPIFPQFPPIPPPFLSIFSIFPHLPPCSPISPHFSPFPPFAPFPPFPPFFQTPKSWFGGLVSSVAVSADACQGSGLCLKARSAPSVAWRPWASSNNVVGMAAPRPGLSVRAETASLTGTQAICPMSQLHRVALS